MEGSIVCAESTPGQLAEWDAIAGISQPLTSPAAISVASPPSAGSEAAQPRGLMSHRSSTTGGVTMRHSVSFQEPLSCHQTEFAPFQALPPVSSHSMAVSSDAVCNRGSVACALPSFHHHAWCSCICFANPHTKLPCHHSIFCLSYPLAVWAKHLRDALLGLLGLCPIIPDVKYVSRWQNPSL